MKPLNFYLILAFAFTSLFIVAQERNSSIVTKEATIEQASSGFAFTEGPAVASNGQIYFTDQPNDRIYLWDENEGVSLWLEGTGRSNGMYFNSDDQLVTCADEKNQIAYFDVNKNLIPIVETFDNKHLNGPNDLWIDKEGGIYFTDPYYHRSWWADGHKEVQDVRGVYYLSATGEVGRVIDDFKTPNGLIGTPDGKTLYVADIEDKKTWKYDIISDGSLINKTFFAPHGSDGMTIDNEGNIYLTYDKVWVFNPDGVLIEEIDYPESPSNICFGGKNRDILFVTARKSVYTLKMNVKGVD